MANDKKLREDLRDGFVKELIEALKGFGIDKEDILLIKSNEIAIPKLDAEKNERYIKIAVSVPTGSRDGDAFDGYAEAEDYARKSAEKAEKAKKAAEAKAKKIAKDKAEREAKAKAKAEGKA